MHNFGCCCVGDTELNGCIGLTTGESQTNTFQISLDIGTELFEVSEPNILLLLALDLLLLASSQRHRANRI